MQLTLPLEQHRNAVQPKWNIHSDLWHLYRQQKSTSFFLSNQLPVTGKWKNYSVHMMIIKLKKTYFNIFQINNQCN